MFTSILAQMAGRGRKVPRAGSLILNSKRAPRNFYKGKGVRSVGKHTKKGGYKLLAERLPNFIVPDLTGFKLKPYVASRGQTEPPGGS